MRVLNIGSLNLDYVYKVDHMVAPGETEDTLSSQIFAGGKGLNQSVAMAKAGVEVYHAGLVGTDGEMLIDVCKKYGINSKYIRTIDERSGHTIIQVDKNGQNSILLYGGANHKLTEDYIDEVLGDFGKNDILVLQNEVNLMPYIIDKAYERGMNIVLNPSPFNSNMQECDLRKISIFMVNEIEGEQITGEKNSDKMISKMRELYSNAKVLLTLGSKGAIYSDETKILKQKIYKVDTVDTTAAGDTFTGYFIAGLINGVDMQQVLDMCARASSVTVSRSGAAESIPTISELGIKL